MPLNSGRRPEPVSVEKLWDELWLGAKDQSNLVIAGSPRNNSTVSLGGSPTGVEHWMGKGPHQVAEPNQTPNTVGLDSRSQPVRDKLHRREGNNPDRQLRSPSVRSVGKDVELQRQPGCWLRGSHHLKSA